MLLREVHAKGEVDLDIPWHDHRQGGPDRRHDLLCGETVANDALELRILWIQRDHATLSKDDVRLTKDYLDYISCGESGNLAGDSQ